MSAAYPRVYSSHRVPADAATDGAVAPRRHCGVDTLSHSHELQSNGVTISFDLALALPPVTAIASTQTGGAEPSYERHRAMTQSCTARRRIVVRTVLSYPETVNCSIEDTGIMRTVALRRGLAGTFRRISLSITGRKGA